MFFEKFTSAELLQLKTNCTIFTPITDRTYWENAKQYNLEPIEEANAEFDGIDRKHLTASLYREYKINGNRSRYEDIYFARRKELVCKTVLTCFYNDDRYMDDIVDLLWMILEESTWTLPAHNHLDCTSDSLPNGEKHFLDLFLAETACTLAFVYQTIGTKLDAISTNLKKRIKRRVTNDAIDNFLFTDDYWWMDIRGGKIGNWNPWICSNILGVSLIMIDDAEKLCKVAYKVMKVVGRYYDHHPMDGACDEGVTYWTHAGLSMMECLWLLQVASDGRINFWQDEKVQNAFAFPAKVYTGGGTYMNYADCSLYVSTYYASIYKIAKLTNNETMLAFSKHLMETTAYPQVAFTKTFRLSDLLGYSAEIAAMETKPFASDTDCYFESTQVMISKTNPDLDNCLLFAAKGGHNNECHNHNDVGSFFVYKNGVKFLVDSGNMVYSKQTFSVDRYKLWTCRSLYHNVPFIGGKEQKDGAAYKAEQVRYQKTEKEVFFSLDIKNAYENCADIQKWERSFVMDKSAEEVRVCESFAFREEMEYVLRFLTPQEVTFANNTVTLRSEEGETLTMEFGGADFSFAAEEKIECKDIIIENSWPKGIRAFSVSAKGKQGTIRYSIK